MVTKYRESTIGALIEKHNNELLGIKEYLEDVPKIKNKTEKIEQKLEKITEIETRIKVLEKQVL